MEVFGNVLAWTGAEGHVIKFLGTLKSAKFEFCSKLKCTAFDIQSVFHNLVHVLYSVHSL